MQVYPHIRWKCKVCDGRFIAPEHKLVKFINLHYQENHPNVTPQEA